MLNYKLNPHVSHYCDLGGFKSYRRDPSAIIVTNLLNFDQQSSFSSSYTLLVNKLPVILSHTDDGLIPNTWQIF